MKVRDYSILALFLGVPYAFIHMGIIHTGHLFFFVLCALVIVSLMQNNIWLSLFFIYAATWQLFLFIDGLSIPAPERQLQIAKGFSQIVFLLAGLSVYVGILKTKLPNETFYKIICISVIVQCLLAVCQLWNHDPIVYALSHFLQIWRRLDEAAIVGTMGNPNFLVGYLAICLPFFFRKPWFYFIPVMAALFYLSKTSAAVIPALMAIPLYYRSIKMFGIFALLAMGYAVYDGNVFVYTEINYRYQLWWEVLKQFESVKDVIFGFGPGAPWGHKFPMHNEWLSLFHSYGLIGLVFIAGFIKSLDRSNRILFAAFGVACLNMIGNYPLHLAPSAFVIIIIVGLIERNRYGHN